MTPTTAAKRPTHSQRIDRAPARTTTKGFVKSHAATSLRFVYFSALAVMFWAGWTQSDVLLTTANPIVESAMWAVGLTVAVCGVLAVVLLAVINYNENQASRRHRAVLQGVLAMRRLGIPVESETPAAGANKVSPAGRTRADAPHANGTAGSHAAWLGWPAFARLVNSEKSAARERGRPFTLLHLRAVKPDQPVGARSIRLEPGHDSTSKLQELLSATMRPNDVASVSPAGDCFMLMPQTMHDVGRAFAGRLAKQVRPVVGEKRLVEIRQFTYVGSRKSEAMRVVGDRLAA